MLVQLHQICLALLSALCGAVYREELLKNDVTMLLLLMLFGMLILVLPIHLIVPLQKGAPCAIAQLFGCPVMHNPA